MGLRVAPARSPLRPPARGFSVGPGGSAIRVIGLTGGIACGKSTVADLLRERGYAVIDADALAREVVAPGEPALQRIVDTFGPEVLGPDGGLDRRALGRIVFSDPERRRQLEAITHPAIAARSAALFEALRAEGRAVAFYEAALLVETGGYRGMDGLVVVSAPRTLQRERLLARDRDLAPADADARIASQMPLAEKEARADFVIVNDGDRRVLAGRVDEMLAMLGDADG